VGHISLQVVCAALRALTAAGLVRRIEPGRQPGPVRGTRRVVADVDCAVGESPYALAGVGGGTPTCLTESDDHGFSIDEAEVIYWGLCPDCSTARSS
jgi:hypothetical protein